MKLHKDFFKITDDNINFLLFLYKNPKFTVEDICVKFDFKYSTFFNHLKEWVKQGHIIEERQPPALGEIKYKYSLSEKSIRTLHAIKNKVLETLE